MSSRQGSCPHEPKKYVYVRSSDLPELKTVLRQVERPDDHLRFVERRTLEKDTNYGEVELQEGE